MEKENLIMIQLVKRPFKRKAILGRLFDEGCFKEQITTTSEAVDYKSSQQIFDTLYEKLNAEKPNTYIKQKIQGRWTILNLPNYNVLTYNLTHMY